MNRSRAEQLDAEEKEDELEFKMMAQRAKKPRTEEINPHVPPSVAAGLVFESDPFPGLLMSPSSWEMITGELGKPVPPEHVVGVTFPPMLFEGVVNFSLSAKSDLVTYGLDERLAAAVLPCKAVGVFLRGVPQMMYLSELRSGKDHCNLTFRNGRLCSALIANDGQRSYDALIEADLRVTCAVPQASVLSGGLGKQLGWWWSRKNTSSFLRIESGVVKSVKLVFPEASFVKTYYSHVTESSPISLLDLMDSSRDLYTSSLEATATISFNKPQSLHQLPLLRFDSVALDYKFQKIQFFLGEQLLGGGAYNPKADARTVGYLDFQLENGCKIKISRVDIDVMGPFPTQLILDELSPDGSIAVRAAVLNRHIFFMRFRKDKKEGSVHETIGQVIGARFEEGMSVGTRERGAKFIETAEKGCLPLEMSYDNSTLFFMNHILCTMGGAPWRDLSVETFQLDPGALKLPLSDTLTLKNAVVGPARGNVTVTKPFFFFVKLELVTSKEMGTYQLPETYSGFFRVRVKEKQLGGTEEIAGAPPVDEDEVWWGFGLDKGAPVDVAWNALTPRSPLVTVNKSLYNAAPHKLPDWRPSRPPTVFFPVGTAPEDVPSLLASGNYKTFTAFTAEPWAVFQPFKIVRGSE